MDHRIKARHAKRLAFRGNVPVYLNIFGNLQLVNGITWEEVSKQYRQNRNAGGYATYWIIY